MNIVFFYSLRFHNSLTLGKSNKVTAQSSIKFTNLKKQLWKQIYLTLAVSGIFWFNVPKETGNKGVLPKEIIHKNN
jgi:hypothetical protein